MTRSFASTFASKKILINAICPGWVDTEMARAGIEDYAKESNVSFDAALKQQMSFVPLQKMSTPKEVALQCYFLSHSGQTSITGQTIDMNNGALMN